jgi:Ser/Thr protein kinase RdoA (MazF antagonist)
MVASTHDFYRRPSQEQIAALTELARAALPAWRLRADSSVELLAERENAVFVITTSDGERFVLRVHRAGYHSNAQLRSQVIWARSLQRDGVVRTADVIDTADGEPFAVVSHPAVPEERQVSLLRWAKGTPLSELGGGAEQEFELIGELMAKLHSHTAKWEPPVGFDMLSWDADGLVGDDPEWGRFWEADGLDADDRALLVSFREPARRELEEFGASPDRFGLIHCDFLADNMLVDGDRITLLDFDDAGYGWHLFDMATALALATLREDFDALRSALVTGYRRHRHLPEDHLTRLPLFLALRAATYVAWVHTRSHTQFAKDMGGFIIGAAVDRVRRYLKT